MRFGQNTMTTEYIMDLQMQAILQYLKVSLLITLNLL